MFLARRDAVIALGFDDQFMRMWHFYLEYSDDEAPGLSGVRRPHLDAHPAPAETRLTLALVLQMR